MRPFMAKVKRSQTLLLVILNLTLSYFVLLSSCSQEDGWAVDMNSLFEVILSEAAVPEDNPMTEEKIDHGHKLFFEPRLSRSGIISCNSCHLVGAAGVDHRDVAIGEQ